MERPFDVLHIGLLVADLPLKVPYEVLDFTEDAVPLSDINILPGGDAANASIVMARLGKSVALAAKVGDVDFGRAVRTVVEKAGVDVRYVKAGRDDRTTISVVLINSVGNRTFLVCRRSTETFCLDDIDLSALKQARHVNFGSLFGSPRISGESGEALFRAAKECGATTSADVTHDGHNIGFEGIRGLLKHVDYFMPSYVEAIYLSGEREPEKMADFFIRETGDKTVIIKLGEEGCFVKSRGKSFRARPYDVQALDTTGAGDNFVAGFLTGLSNGWDLAQCADFACAVAGFSVQYLGATTPEMSMQRILDFMKRTPHK